MRRIFQTSHLGLIVAGAAAAAAATLYGIVAIGLPLLCPDGLSADRCLTPESAPAVAASPQVAPAIEPAAVQEPPPEKSVPAPRAPIVIPETTAPPKGFPTPRIVKTIPIRPTSDSAPPATESRPTPTEEEAPLEMAEPPPPTEGNEDTQPATETAPVEGTPPSDAADASTPEAPLPLPLSERPVADEQAPTPADTGGLTVKSDVNVRSGPSRSSERLFSLPAGDEVKVDRTDGGWKRITDSQGRTGWAHESFLE